MSSAYNTCDVTKGPNGLLADVRVGWSHQTDEGWDGPTVHYSSGLVWGARGDVGQGPSRLKLDGGAFR